MLAFSANAVAYLVGVGVSLAAAVFAFRLRKAPGGFWLFMTLVASTIWAVFETLDFSSTTLVSHTWFVKLSYIGATTAPVFYFLFALEYCGIVSRVGKALAGSLLAIPIAVTSAGFFNDYHHLVWLSYTPDPLNPNTIVYAHGPLYYLVILYCLTLAALASIPIAGLALRVRGIYRTQGVATVVAVLFPMAAQLAYALDPVHLAGFDPAITLGLTGGVLVVSMLRYRLLDLVPVPRETLIEEMPEGVMVFDAYRRIIEINPAAADLLGLSARPQPGMSADNVLTSWSSEVRDEFWAIEPGEAKQFEAESGRCIGVQRTSFIAGWEGRPRDLFVLRDITQQVKAENALNAAYRALALRVEQIESLQGELREQATHDELTGLHNRRYLVETLERELARARREGYPVSIVMLDIDHFKQINDTLGHTGGDAVLQVLGAEIRATSRLGDIGCRYGGDEFLVVLPNTTTESAIRLAERWRMTLKAAMAREVGDLPAPTVSLGVATFPQDGADLDAVVVAADSAVYAAKYGGRDRVAIASRHAPISSSEGHDRR
jgi:diguanylate cyclase (GGDEF)-like protein/PAS domain S-box-containing protein